MNISPLASVHPKAELGEDISIDPFAHIHEDVIIGEGTKIHSNVVLYPGTRIGKNCEIFPGAVIGVIPQDLKFGGEYTIVEIGDHTVIRECVTIHRGIQDKGVTKIGHDNLFMAYVHIAHDCIVGSNNVFANNAGLAGHVEVGSSVVIGAPNNLPI